MSYAKRYTRGRRLHEPVEPARGRGARRLSAINHRGWQTPLDPGNFSIRSWSDRETMLFALHGELDLASGAELEQRLQRAEAAGPARIVIDLSALDFIDCTGLRILLRALQRAGDAGCDFQLLPGPPHIQRVFDLTGMAAVLTPRETG